MGCRLRSAKKRRSQEVFHAISHIPCVNFYFLAHSRRGNLFEDACMLRIAVLFTILFSTAGLEAQQALRPGNSVQGSVSDSDTVSYVIDVAAEHFIMGEIEDLTGDALNNLFFTWQVCY